MTILANHSNQTTRLLLYVMVCTIIVAFGSVGSIFAAQIGGQYSLMGLFLGAALGAFIAVYESTIIGCVVGMVFGLIVSPLVYYYIDFETAFLVAFVTSLFGAIMGEPLAFFWNKAEEIEEIDNFEDYESFEQEFFQDTTNANKQDHE